MLRLRSGSLSIVGGNWLLGGRVRRDPGGRTADTDEILAAAFSPSGEYFAVTDERKRLLLFHVLPAWELLSVRGVSRRCTALTFTPSESHLLAADKSGDVFSFSVTNLQEEGGQELGHLSMLLDLVVSGDGRHVISCDRDEKIRVSLWGAPHVISAFCLGHTQFVSQLLVLPGMEGLLLSGSGDGTLRLWRYESGRELHRLDLADVLRPADDAEVKRFPVSRLSCSPGGEHVAALCDGVAGVYLFLVCAGPVMSHTQYIRTPGPPLDVDFEDSGSLWVLSGLKEAPVQVYTYTQGSWKLSPVDSGMKRLCCTIQENWERLAGSVSPGSRFGGLYKVVCDNMATYLQKKAARIQSEKRKLPPGQEEAAAKVQKT